jgi:hypothetical protein
VLLIEAGPSDIGVAAIDDAARWTALLRGIYDWGYDYAPNAARQRPPHRHSARAGAGRLEQHQCYDLESRPSQRLRLVGGCRRDQLEFCDRAPLFQTGRGLGRRRDSLARRRRSAPDRAAARSASDCPRHVRSRRRPRGSGHRRHERTEQRGSQFSQPERRQWRALERFARLSPPRHGASQSDHRHQFASDEAWLRVRPLRVGDACCRRHAACDLRGAGSHSLRRRDRHAASPDDVRHRRRGRVEAP